MTLKQSDLLSLWSRSKNTRRKRCSGLWTCRWTASSTSPTWPWTSGSLWSAPGRTARSSWRPLSGWGRRHDAFPFKVNKRRLVFSNLPVLHLQVLSVDKPPPKVIPNPPPQLKEAPPTNPGDQLLKPPPPVATSTPTLPASNTNPAAHPSQNGLNGQYAGSHRGSMLALDSYPTSSSASSMRRFDSHSLLSDNSIASSRFDVSEGAQYPEWVSAVGGFPPPGRNASLSRVWDSCFLGPSGNTRARSARSTWRYVIPPWGTSSSSWWTAAGSGPDRSQILFFRSASSRARSGPSLCPAGTCSPAVRMVRTRTPACICSRTSPGDIVKRPTWRRGRSTPSSTRSKIRSLNLPHTFLLYEASLLLLECPECLRASSFCRFEFDVPLQEIQTRKLDVSVKNNKMFYTRERKDIGTVGQRPGGVDLITPGMRRSMWPSRVSRSSLVRRYSSIFQRGTFPKASQNGTDSRKDPKSFFHQKNPLLQREYSTLIFKYLLPANRFCLGACVIMHRNVCVCVCDKSWYVICLFF